MSRTLAVTLLVAISSTVLAENIEGTYVEARTCQVYTGPCFANGEVGLAGKNAVMSWRITDGYHGNVDLQGLSVAVVVKGSHTFGFRGLKDAKTKHAIVIVDQTANAKQRAALHQFALEQTELESDQVQGVYVDKIKMDFDTSTLTAELTVGKSIHLKTRKARPGDCICSNESAYYPPLAKLKGSAPGVTIQGKVAARKLGTRWSIPDSRTAYMGVFDLNNTLNKVALR